MKKIFLILTLASQIALAKADLLFEGYSKILSGKNQVGYIVNRYEFDNSQKQFISTTFLKTNEFGGNLTESLKAYATEDLKPVSYQYTTIVGAETKTIDAKFNNGKMTATIFDGKKTSKVNKPLPNGAFLSTFLAYVMLKSPQGFKADTKYDYQAVAEEDAAIYTGHAIVKQQEDYMGFKLFHVENEFKGSKFISYVSERGEMFSTNSPVQNISTELVAHAADATNNFKVPTSIVKSLFGSIPLGTKNEVSAKADKTPDKKSPEKK